MTTATEFRPVPKSSVAPKVLAAVFGVIILGGIVAMLGLLTSSGVISYRITGSDLVVDSGSRLDGVREVPLSLVRERRVVTLTGGRRVRGTAMPGLCSGKWWFEEVGSVWLAGNCSTRGVLVVTGSEERIAITPPDPDAFVRMLDARPATEGRIELPAPSDTTLLRVIPGVSILVMIVAGVMMLATFLVAPGRMVYLARGGELEVQTLFSRSKWRASELRARRHEPAAARRVAGTAFPGYYTGRFRADGKATRMFASDLKSGVLVEGPDVRIFLSPAEPDAFLAALKREGATIG